MCHVCEELLSRLKNIPIKDKRDDRALRLVIMTCFSIVHTVPLSEVKYCPVCGKEIAAAPVNEKRDKIYYNPLLNIHVREGREDSSDNWAYWRIEMNKTGFNYVGTTPFLSIEKVEKNSDWVLIK